MCGRFGMFANPMTVKHKFDILIDDLLLASYNISPTDMIYTITQEQPNTLSIMRWGFKHSLGIAINARLETLEHKAMFKPLLAQQKCLILANGYYEWAKIGKTKQPYFISKKNDELFCFAGLYQKSSEGGGALPEATIITAQPIDSIAWIHNRMPVVLKDEDMENWLKSPFDHEKTLPSKDLELMARGVSGKVGSNKNNNASLIHAIEEQGRLF